MQESTSREKVLKRIRKALIGKTANPYPDLDTTSSVFEMNDDAPELIFAKTFREAGGHFIFCEDMLEFADSFLNLVQSKKWKQLHCYDSDLKTFLIQCEFPLAGDKSLVTDNSVAVSLSECLIARTGSMMISSGLETGRGLPALSKAHVVVGFTHQLVDDISDAFNLMKKRYNSDLPSSMTIITGPSRTADIGNEVVVGAQGPEDLFFFMIDKPL